MLTGQKARLLPSQYDLTGWNWDPKEPKNVAPTEPPARLVTGNHLHHPEVAWGPQCSQDSENNIHWVWDMWRKNQVAGRPSSGLDKAKIMIEYDHKFHWGASQQDFENIVEKQFDKEFGQQQGNEGKGKKASGAPTKSKKR